MRYRSNIYEFTLSARYILAVMWLLCPAIILASSSCSKDTVCIAKNMDSVVNRVISDATNGKTM